MLFCISYLTDMESIIAYFGLFLAMLVLDGCWLFYAGRKIYPKYIGHLMSTDEKGGLKPNWLAAGVFYIMYTVVVFILVVQPNLATGNTAQALVSGALTGLLAYGTYDLTNQATLKNWAWRVTIIDMIWGTLLTGIVSGVAVWAGGLI